MSESASLNSNVKETQLSKKAQSEARTKQNHGHPSHDLPIPQKSVKPMLAVLFVASFIAAFNENIINVALADIMNQFSITATTANLLVTGYMIVTTIIVAIIAFLLRRFNLRTIFFSGAILFIAGSLLAMVAPNYPLLLTFRLIQAIGTGIFIPTMMNTILIIAPRKSIGTYLAIGNCCITFGPAFGPLVSGFMITLFGWRTIFLIPSAVMIIAVIAAIFLVKNISKPQKLSLDLPSLGMSVFGLSFFVYGLSEIMSNTVLALVLIAIGVAIIALFVRRQEKLKHPMLNIAPLKNPLFLLTCLMVMIAMMTTFSLSVLLPLYLQQALGLTAFAAGALIVIPVLAQGGTAVIGGRIIDTKGGWPLLPIAFVFMAVGLVVIALTASQFSVILIIIGGVIAFAGVGLGFSESQTAGLKTLTNELHPFGVGLMSTFIQMAAAIGPSLFVGLLSAYSITGQASGMDYQSAQAYGASIAISVAAIVAIIGIIIAIIQTRKALAQEHIAAPTQSASATSHILSRNLADIMHTDVYSVSHKVTAGEAIELMLSHHTSGLPVVNDRNHVIGFISDGDIMKSIGDVDTSKVNLYYSLSNAINDKDFDQRVLETLNANVMELATKNTIAVQITDSVETVCSLLAERRIKKLPVLKGRELVGTISRSDINRYIMTGFAAKRNAE